jgi:hypothetical protein
MRKAVSLHKTISRLVDEVIIAIGVLSITTGVLQKLFHLNSIYDPRLLGLTPKDFLAFGGICFLLAIAIASRRMLKHLELLVEKK